MNKIDLSGRCAIVTGGAQGFGLSISKRFIESGAKVMIWDIDKNLVDKLENQLDEKSSLFDIFPLQIVLVISVVPHLYCPPESTNKMSFVFSFLFVNLFDL